MSRTSKEDSNRTMKPSGEASSPSHAQDSAEKDACIASLEVKPESLGSESTTLLETESQLRRTIQRMSTEHFKYECSNI